MKKKILFLLVSLIIVTGIIILDYYNLIPKKTYQASDFNIEEIYSENDKDLDQVDDYHDLMLGARSYVQTKPKYKNAYYGGGYPPMGEGVCTDVIWYAFQEAGYDLKIMVDDDIKQNPSRYDWIEIRDSNIDFRRVNTLLAFFEAHATSLTLDPKQISEWQPGDIVIFDGHIGMISDKRNKQGIAYVIHHGGQPVYEEDALTRYDIVGHFRYK